MAAATPSAASVVDLKSLTKAREQSSVQEIIPGVLFLGPLSVAQNRAALKALGVRAVVCVMKAAECPFKNDGVEYLHVPVRLGLPLETSGLLCAVLISVVVSVAQVADDQSQMTTWFEPINAFISKHRAAKSPVLVHCSSGISRSATATLGYLMDAEHMTLLAAWQLVLAKRIILPNDQLFQNLCALEQTLFHKRQPTAIAAPSSTATTLSTSDSKAVAVKYVASMAVNSYRAMSLLATVFTAGQYTYEQVLQAIVKAGGDVETALSALF
jgi:hypothetical protein